MAACYRHRCLGNLEMVDYCESCGTTGRSFGPTFQPRSTHDHMQEGVRTLLQDWQSSSTPAVFFVFFPDIHLTHVPPRPALGYMICLESACEPYGNVRRPIVLFGLIEHLAESQYWLDVVPGKRCPDPRLTPRIWPTCGRMSMSWLYSSLGSVYLASRRLS